ncbi:Transcriptional regulator BkdR of isoleucine and valine catabolism operon [Desulfosporosinus metallidurans]|uniref:Transcriptional regulator BkdR of isoleucine and valine catabolism operon n=1 Tax=Desulfosporosinus metallidurans TaxID=1888891 RepID=A0A1Q8QUE0_9FIRM|nr:Transcriptional regulator BkdR of isoleucine and valine catabolism operon [Desulfosporosinus metallidurans]
MTYWRAIEIHHLPAHIIPIHEDCQSDEDKPYDVKEILGRVEKELILSALATYNNRTNAMKALGISRRAFYDKLRRYGIEV